MKNEDIKRIALASGFELKDLPDGSKGLRPYVFEFAKALLAAERQAVADICDELEEHWSEYKDAALLNGDVALSNAASGEPRAASGEPRAARAIKAAVLARNGKPFEWSPKK